MSRRRQIWYLYPCYILVTVVAMLSLMAVTDTAVNTENALRGLLVAIVTGSLGFFFTWRISRKLERVSDGARRFANGDLDFRLDVPDSEELGGLVEALNEMAAQLNERIHTISRQRREQETVLAGMLEGVIAVDEGATILQVNTSAARLIGTSTEKIMGRSLYEVIRNRDLHQLVARALDEEKPVEGEIILHSGNREKSIQIHCTSLRGVKGADHGALIVLNDITRLRRLERVRRDFVANVSHELKTPLTSIKGYVETLLDGALDQKDEAVAFCSIIARQVDRLQAIIEDLLSLSRIEQEVERGQIALSDSILRASLLAAFDTVAAAAAEKNITIQIVCDEEQTAMINPPLFEQVAINLIDNAIKYSDAGKTIIVRADAGESSWNIRFIDQGCGIDSENLTRIFERFYRVDKARSRKAGGTGLGLAIVKHIVAAHGGDILVESKPGQGSTFTVSIPRKPTPETLVTAIGA